MWAPGGKPLIGAELPWHEAIKLPAAESRWLPDPKPRVVILSEISNEPDDQQSLVRFLTYANEGIGHIISVLGRDDPRPVWFCAWGGGNTLGGAVLRLQLE